MRLKNKIAWFIAQHLPSNVLLYAVVRAFAYFGDAGDHNYKEVWDMVVKKHKLSNLDV